MSPRGTEGPAAGIVAAGALLAWRLFPVRVDRVEELTAIRRLLTGRFVEFCARYPLPALKLHYGPQSDPISQIPGVKPDPEQWALRTAP